MRIAALTVLGATAVLAVAQPHKHVHRHALRHAGRHGSPVERRAADVTQYVDGPTVIVYSLDGEDVPANQVEDGIKNGIYVLVTEPAATTTSTTTTSATTTSQAAEFFQVKSSSSTTTTTTTTTTPLPTTTTTTTTTTPVPTTTTTTTTTSTTPSATPSAASTTASSSGSGSSSGTGVDSDFPSGEISCSTFPSSYGAVAQSYLGLNGWTGVQNVPSYSLTDTVISYIETAVSGGCTSDSFCSYACPPGYQKSQWPTAQGNTGQSIGGLYCNTDGKLELSNPTYSTLCIAGTGGISVKNTLSDVVSICRTDYPGTESETIPTEVEGGSTEGLTCPDASSYYTWQGKGTSAQYYINPSGNDKSKACLWGTDGSNLGNFAPVNLGVGKGADGNTYISMFQNSPTNTDGCLDYSITITGDVSSKCSYSSCKFYNNGVESSSGCTVS